VSYAIKTKSGNVFRVWAWTGGDTPRDGNNLCFRDKTYREIRSALFRDQLKDSGGLDLWYFPDEEMKGTTPLQRARIFWNRATLDAWRTWNKEVNE
jgi:hypothetical protein